MYNRIVKSAFRKGDHNTSNDFIMRQVRKPKGLGSNVAYTWGPSRISNAMKSNEMIGLQTHNIKGNRTC